MQATFVCHDCGDIGTIAAEGATGYATYRHPEAGPVVICYACADRRQGAKMERDGATCLYLYDAQGRRPRVGTWTGGLMFPAVTRTGRHNMAGERTDVWFRDASGSPWYGVNVGDNDLVRCRRVKESRAFPIPRPSPSEAANDVR